MLILMIQIFTYQGDISCFWCGIHNNLKYFNFCFGIYLILRIQMALHNVKVQLRVELDLGSLWTPPPPPPQVIKYGVPREVYVAHPSQKALKAQLEAPWFDMTKNKILLYYNEAIMIIITKSMYRAQLLYKYNLLHCTVLKAELPTMLLYSYTIKNYSNSFWRQVCLQQDFEDNRRGFSYV